MTNDYWYRQIKRWIDTSIDEPDLMGLELVREFDNLAEKFYSTFADDFNECTESKIHIGLRSTVVREEVDFVVESSYLTSRPADVKRTGRKIESVPVSAF
ncbi:MAG: hypothetical protein ACRD8Z_15530, partial [Nitrososphaeraceae archaeon]